VLVLIEVMTGSTPANAYRNVGLRELLLLDLGILLIPVAGSLLDCAGDQVLIMSRTDTKLQLLAVGDRRKFREREQLKEGSVRIR